MKKSEKRPKKRLKTKSKDQTSLSHIPKELRKIVADSIFRYLNALGVNQYRSRIFYMKKDDEPGYANGETSNKLASAQVDRRYLTLNVNIYPVLINGWIEKKFDNEDVSQFMAHEVSHIVTQHMYTMATAPYKDEGEMKDAWESLTTIVGRLLHEVEYHRRNKK